MADQAGECGRNPASATLSSCGAQPTGTLSGLDQAAEEAARPAQAKIETERARLNAADKASRERERTLWSERADPAAERDPRPGDPPWADPERPGTSQREDGLLLVPVAAACAVAERPSPAPNDTSPSPPGRLETTRPYPAHTRMRTSRYIFAHSNTSRARKSWEPNWEPTTAAIGRHQATTSPQLRC